MITVASYLADCKDGGVLQWTLLDQCRCPPSLQNHDHIQRAVVRLASGNSQHTEVKTVTVAGLHCNASIAEEVFAAAGDTFRSCA